MKNRQMPPTENHLFDRKSVEQHRNRSINMDWAKHGFLFEEVSDRLAERLMDISRTFEMALDLGCRSGALGERLMQYGEIDHLISADLCVSWGGNLTSNFVVVDEEWLPFASHSFDLVGSALNLHWTNDLPGALVQIFRSLKPDGLFLGALFGVESLHELKWCLMQAESEIRGGVSPRISPFAEIRDAGGLLQRAGFALPVTDVDMITLKYSSAFDLMKELRGMGENNSLVMRQKSFTGRKVLFRAAELYQENYQDEDGLIPASFQIIYLAGWSPHENQQKPLRPGSGKASLIKTFSEEKDI